MNPQREEALIANIMRKPLVNVSNVDPLEASAPSTPSPKGEDSLWVDEVVPDISHVEVPEDFAKSICEQYGEKKAKIDPEPVVEEYDEDNDPILEIKVSMKRKSGRTQDMWLSDVEIAKYKDKLKTLRMADKESNKPRKAKAKQKVTRRNDPSYLHKDARKAKEQPDPDKDVKTYVKQQQKDVDEMTTGVGSIGVNMAPTLNKRKKRGLKDSLSLASKLQKEKK